MEIPHHKIVVSIFLMHWRYCSLVLIHQYIEVFSMYGIYMGMWQCRLEWHTSMTHRIAVIGKIWFNGNTSPHISKCSLCMECTCGCDSVGLEWHIAMIIFTLTTSVMLYDMYHKFPLVAALSLVEWLWRHGNIYLCLMAYFCDDEMQGWF